MATTTYPLAKQGVFPTVQGEGALLGLPTVFVRLGGCDVNCESCDTNYAVAERVTAAELASRVSQCYYGATRWLWLTGGEPTLYDLAPLVAELRGRFPALRLALATAGEREVRRGSAWGGFDFVSVSPHRPDRWVQRTGSQLNLVPGLNGVKLVDFLPFAEEAPKHFSYCYVTPREGDAESMRECRNWVAAVPGYRLGVQAHKAWGVP